MNKFKFHLCKKAAYCPLLLGALFFQCTSETIKLPLHNLAAVKKIDIVSDSILFQRVDCMSFNDNMIFFSNPVYDNIVCVDSNLNLIRTIGKKGNGPNDLLGIQYFAVSDSVLCVANIGNHRVNLYSLNGELIDELAINNTQYFYPYRKFGFDGKKMFTGTFLPEKYPLIEYDIYAPSEVSFGTLIEFSSRSETAMRNNRLIASVDSFIFVVSEFKPYIEKYSRDHTLVESFDYSAIKEIRQQLDYLNGTDIEGDNIVTKIIGDVYRNRNFLYILFTHHADDDYGVNEIIQFDIEPSINPVAIYKLEGKVFGSFCVSSDNKAIYAYEYLTNTIQTFYLD